MNLIEAECKLRCNRIHEPDEQKGLFTLLFDSLVAEIKNWFSWAFYGALIGCLIIGGFWFYFFGFSGLLIASGVGAALGAIIGFFGYIHLTTIT